MWHELHPNLEVIHVRPVPELVDIELEHMSTNNNNTTDPIRGVPPLLAARAALAAEEDGPAVPEGREPASVVGEPSDEELLELAQQYSVSYTMSDGTVVYPLQEGCDMRDDVLSFARAVLARHGHQPAPLVEGEGASLEEVEELCEEHCFNVEGYESIECLQGLINDVLARYGHQPAPVPPAEGEVGELAAKLRRLAPHNPLGTADPTITRAADLLEQRHPAPVPVSERLPGPEDCDGEGRCWLHFPDMGIEPLWRLTDPPMRSRYYSHWLPANALPLPKGEVK